MTDQPNLTIDWGSGLVGDGEAIRIMARRGNMPVEIVIFRSQMLAASELTDDDLLARIGGMHAWLEDAIGQAMIAGRLLESGEGGDQAAILLVIWQDFDLTGDRICGRAHRRDDGRGRLA